MFASMSWCGARVAERTVVGRARVVSDKLEERVVVSWCSVCVGVVKIADCARSIITKDKLATHARGVATARASAAPRGLHMPPTPTQAPGLRSALEVAYSEFAESDAAIAATRAVIQEREAQLAARTEALQRRKAQLLAEIEAKKRSAAAATMSPSSPPPPPKSDPPVPQDEFSPVVTCFEAHDKSAIWFDMDWSGAEEWLPPEREAACWRAAARSGVFELEMAMASEMLRRLLVQNKYLVSDRRFAVWPSRDRHQLWATLWLALRFRPHRRYTAAELETEMARLLVTPDDRVAFALRADLIRRARAPTTPDPLSPHVHAPALTPSHATRPPRALRAPCAPRWQATLSRWTRPTAAVC